MRKILFSCLISILLFSGADVTFASEFGTISQQTNASTGYEAIIRDEADLLSFSEETALLNQMMPITEYGDVVFMSVSENPRYSTASYIEEIADSYFGDYGSGTVFMIDMDNRELYIYSKGAIYDLITDAYAYSITDNIYTYATDQQYYTCASKAFEQIETLLAGGLIGQPMKYISNLFLAMAIALLINFFIAMATTRKKKAKLSELLPGIFRNATITNPNAQFTNQSRRYSPQSSSSSGGRRGSGGGGRGGGGGHRF